MRFCNSFSCLRRSYGGLQQKAKNFQNQQLIQIIILNTSQFILFRLATKHIIGIPMVLRHKIIITTTTQQIISEIIHQTHKNKYLNILIGSSIQKSQVTQFISRILCTDVCQAYVGFLRGKLSKNKTILYVHTSFKYTVQYNVVKYMIYLEYVYARFE